MNTLYMSGVRLSSLRLLWTFSREMRKNPCAIHDKVYNLNVYIVMSKQPDCPAVQNKDPMIKNSQFISVSNSSGRQLLKVGRVSKG